MLQFSDNLMTHLLMGRSTKELEQLKHLNLKIQEVALNIAITEKKEKKMSDKSHIPTRGIYL